MKSFVELQILIENSENNIHDRFLALAELHRRFEQISNSKLNEINRFVDKNRIDNHINSIELINKIQQDLNENLFEKNEFISKQDRRIRYLEECEKEKNSDINALHLHLKEKMSEISALSSELNMRDLEISQLRNSLSMKLTEPLRWLSKKFRGISNA